MNDALGKLPSLNGLKAFEAAARHLNFRLAAEELGVTQGAVAQQVRGLEAELGLQLFERRPRTLALTGEGRAYIADIRRAFEIIARATGDLKPQPVKLAISTTPTFASKWLIPRLPDLTAQHPDLDIHIVATDRISNFQMDGVDLAVRYGRPPFGPGLAAQLLFKQEIIAACSPMLLGDRGPPRTVSELSCFPLLQDAHNFWPEFIESHFGTAASPREVPLFKRISFNQTSHAIDAAVAGQGIVLATRNFIASDIAGRRLVQVGSTALWGPSDFYLVWPRHSKAAALQAAMSWMLSADGQGRNRSIEAADSQLI